MHKFGTIESFFIVLPWAERDSLFAQDYYENGRNDYIASGGLMPSPAGAAKADS
jgi:hypothetical protein